MINKRINSLITESEIEKQNKIEEGLIYLGVILAVYLIGWVISTLYEKFSRVRVSPQYLKYYSPLRKEFFEFLDIVDQHSDEFTHLRTSFKNELMCSSISGPNKELECLINYAYGMQVLKVQILLSTLYDDGYDLLNIRSVNDLSAVSYIKTTSMNEAISSFNNGLATFKNVVMTINKLSINEFGVPLSASIKDFEQDLERIVRSVVAQSANWR